MSKKKAEGALIIIAVIFAALFFIIQKIIQFVTDYWVILIITSGVIAIVLIGHKLLTIRKIKKEKQEKEAKSRHDFVNRQIIIQNQKVNELFNQKVLHIKKSESSVLTALVDIRSTLINESSNTIYPNITANHIIVANSVSSYDNSNYEDCKKLMDSLLKLLSGAKDRIMYPWTTFLYHTTKFNEESPKKKYELLINRIFIVKPNDISTEDFIDKGEFFNDYQSHFENFEMKVREKNLQLSQLYDSIILEVQQLKEEIQILINNYHDDWIMRKNEFITQQKAQNEDLDKLRTGYLKQTTSSIEIFNQKILEKIEYLPDSKISVRTNYQKGSKGLIIEYLLPEITSLPRIKDRRYLKTSQKYKNIEFSEKELEGLYENVIYKICLISLYNIFNNDEINAIQYAVFNGFSGALNPATGKKNRTCIMTLSCTKQTFLELNIENVDPKACFKKLKGIAAPKLADLIAVRPIQSLSRMDKRFVDSEEVIIDSSTNLASMDWKEFEHLVRELFEKEFSSNGGEVKVTQSSRDGGVDAIAYDPDILRGGKIVIQAKRYTNTVGLSAVRDLWGTTIHEGANKGILVTTSDYGPDAYAFAKDKPITLINGQNLLYLIEKHNYSARIDIAEAKRNNENN